MEKDREREWESERAKGEEEEAKEWVLLLLLQSPLQFIQELQLCWRNNERRHYKKAKGAAWKVLKIIVNSKINNILA